MERSLLVSQSRSDGVYTKEEAEAALKELAPAPKKEPAKKAAPKKAASKSK